MEECHITVIEPFDIVAACRLCLTPATDAINIFSEDSSVASVILSFASIKVCQDDGLPAQICQPCHHQLFASYEFYLKCQETDMVLRKIGGANCSVSKCGVVVEKECCSASRQRSTDGSRAPVQSLQGGIQGDQGRTPRTCSREAAESCPGIDAAAVSEQDVTLVEVFADFDDNCTPTRGEQKASPGEDCSHNDRPEKDDDWSGSDPEDVALSPPTGPVLISVRKFECRRCGERFAHHNDLWHHETLHVRRQGPDCPVCYKHFTSNYNLDVHMRVHNGLKPYKCDQCNSSFAQRGTLQNHMKKHSGARPHKCGTCGRGFFNKEGVLVHQRVHASDPLDLELNECPLCDKAFVYPSGLSRHLSLHATSRLFTCDLCSKKYKELPSLKRHMSSKHGFH